MTETHKYRVVIYKEIVATELKDYAETNRDYYKLQEMFPDLKIELEKVLERGE